MRKIRSILFRFLMTFAILGHFACSALTSGGGGAVAPSGGLTSGTVNQLDASAASDGGGDGSGTGAGDDGNSGGSQGRNENPFLDGQQTAANDPLSGGFADPDKHLEGLARIQLVHFEDMCLTKSGKFRAKVTAYLIPLKDKIGPRIIRLVDDGQQYINLKTKDEPDPETNGWYEFHFKITTKSYLPLGFFLISPDDPDSLDYNKEIDCTANKCSSNKWISWSANWSNYGGIESGVHLPKCGAAHDDDDDQ